MTVTTIKMIKPDVGKVLVSPDGQTHCVSVLLKEGEDETGWTEADEPDEDEQEPHPEP